MSLDLKIEIFAHLILNETWMNLGILKTKPNILGIFEEECCKVENCMEAYNATFPVAVLCRRKVFGEIYLKDLTHEKASSLKSLCDCYNYVNSTCDRDDLFGHLTVFERMLSTCSFVVDFCIRIHDYNVVDVVKYGPTFWAMHFDKFTEEFYEEGGWNQLAEVAQYYLNIHEFFLFFDATECDRLEKAIDDYYDFMENRLYDYKEKKINVSKLWIKYSVKRLESCAKIPSTHQYCVNISDIEEILENLKALFDCLLTKKSASIDKESSMNSEEYDAYLDSLNAHEVTKISTSIDTESSINTDEYDAYLDSLNAHKVTKKSTSIDNESSINSEESDAYLDSLNAHEVTKKSTSIDTESSINTDEYDAYLDSLNAHEEISTNQMDESICYRKSKDTTNISSEKGGVKDSYKEEARIERILEVNCSLKNADNRKKIALKTEIISTRQMAKSELDGNSFSCIPASQVTDNLYSLNTEMRSSTPIAPVALFETQMDASICYRKPSPYNVPGTTNISLEKSLKCSVEELSTERTLEVSCTSKSGDDQKEILMRSEIMSTSQAKKTESNGKSSSDILDIYKDNLYSRNTEGERATLLAPEAFCRNHKDVSSCYRNPSQYSDLDTTKCSSENVENDSFEEVHNKKILKTMCSLKNGDKKIEIAKTTEIMFTSHMAKSESDENSQHILIQQCIDTLNSENTGKLSETLCTSEVLSKNQMNPPLCSRKLSPYKRKFGTEGESNPKEVRVETTLELNCKSENRDDQREIVNRTEILSLNQMAKSELDVKTTPDILPIPKVYNLENLCENTNDEMENNEKAMKDLRSEHDVHDIKVFLRMILVLSDRQGAKFVLQALQSNEDGPEKTQVTRKKLKKKKKMDEK